MRVFFSHCESVLRCLTLLTYAFEAVGGGVVVVVVVVAVMMMMKLTTMMMMAMIVSHCLARDILNCVSDTNF